MGEEEAVRSGTRVLEVVLGKELEIEVELGKAVGVEVVSGKDLGKKVELEVG